MWTDPWTDPWTDASTTRVPRAPKPYDKLLRLTLKSLAAYWTTAMPEVYGEPYEPLAGGIYAYTENSTMPPCGGVALPYVFVQQNAFYCPESDFIAWDDEQLFPRLESRYGPFLLSVVLAHEWGHAIQKRAGLSDLDGLTLEQQADCFAGAWSGALQRSKDPELAALRDRHLDRSLAGFVEIRDRLGMTGDDLGAHGTAFDRIRAFQDGVENGAQACKRYEDSLPTLVAVPYRSFKERFRGGNLPYETVLASMSSRIDEFWSSTLGATESVVLRQEEGVAFCSARLVSPQGFSDGGLAWCADDGTLYYSDTAMRRTYESLGDFAVATELALTRALAHEARSGFDPYRKATWLRAICTVGAWTGSMYEPDHPEKSVLSPGDVDEGVQILLASANTRAEQFFGSGFQQVASFRVGVLGSVRDCGSPVSS